MKSQFQNILEDRQEELEKRADRDIVDLKWNLLFKFLVLITTIMLHNMEREDGRLF